MINKNSLKALISFLCCIISITGFSQQLLKGTVTDATTGTPLQGVTLTLHFSGKTSVSNAAGAFTISISNAADTLTATHIGYAAKKMVVRAIQENITIQLSRSEAQLEDVVVNTGYQLVPKERSTGSFSHTNNATLNQQVTTGIAERLESVANGLIVDRQTNSSGKLMIRGLSTIRGPKDPLIVVDNFPYEGDIDNINPNDVESITLLKDAAAASIWGTRAGNGVIVITTKKGKYSQPLSVEFNTNFTIIGKPDLSYVKQMSSSEVIDLEQWLFTKKHRFADTNSLSRSPFTPVYEILFKQMRGQLSAADVQAQLNALRAVDVKDQFNRSMYRNGLNQQYAVNLRGGSSNHAWMMSMGYDNNRSVSEDEYKRYNIRFQNSIKAWKNAELTASAYYTQSKSHSGKPGWGEVSWRGNDLYPYARFADDAGNALAVVKDLRQVYTDTAGSGKLLNWKYYPLNDYLHNYTTATLQDVVVNIGLQQRFLKNFTAELKYQYQSQHETIDATRDEESYYARDIINKYSQVNPVTRAVTYAIPIGSIIETTNNKTSSYAVRSQLGYSRAWSRHNITAIAGGEIREVQTTTARDGVYGYNPNTLTVALIDYVNMYPMYNGSKNFIPNGTLRDEKLNRFVSLFANAAYTYNGRYTLTLSGRRDANNMFGVNTNNKWQPLWSAGAAWELSKEQFYKLHWLPYVKLRASYGFTGNVDPSMTAVTTIIINGTSPFTQTPFANFQNRANPDLKWETVGITNVGLDFKTSRVSGSVEYYVKKGKDLFGTAPIDVTVGAGSSIVKNVAKMRGKGVDIELNTVNIKRAIQWETQLNLSFYNDKVLAYYLPPRSAASYIGSTGSIPYGVEGKPVYAMLSYHWGGLDSVGDPQGYFKDKLSKDYGSLTGTQSSLSDLMYHGSVLPKIFGSMGNTISYKGFSITARISYKFGHYFRRSSIDYTRLFDYASGHSDYSLRWQQKGDEFNTHVPAVVYPNPSARQSFYNGSEVLVSKADNIRLQYVHLSYRLDKKQWKAIPFKTAELYVNVANLGLLWASNHEDADPEYRNSIPPSRTISVGLRTQF